MIRFAKYLCAFILFSLAVALIGFGYIQSEHASEGVNTFKSVSEFDLLGYNFGIVAVAVTFAGVYISIVPDRCTTQMLQMIEDHFIPDPFADRENMSSVCQPANCTPGAVRTDAIKGIHAVIALKRWVALSEDQRSAYIGNDGIDPHEGWFRGAFLFFQTKVDRLYIVALAVTISMIYVFVPAIYLFKSERLPETVLSVIYILCIIEMILCISFFAYREVLFYQFEKRFNEWRGQIGNFMLANLVSNVSSVIAPATGQPALAPPPSQNGP